MFCVVRYARVLNIYFVIVLSCFAHLNKIPKYRGVFGVFVFHVPSDGPSLSDRFGLFRRVDTAVAPSPSFETSARLIARIAMFTWLKTDSTAACPRSKLVAFFFPRQHAPIAMGAAGARVVVAESYARIFFRNSIATGEVSD